MSIEDHLIKFTMWWQGVQKLRNDRPGGVAAPPAPRQFRHWVEAKLRNETVMALGQIIHAAMNYKPVLFFFELANFFYSIWIRAGDDYLTAEIYTLEDV